MRVRLVHVTARPSGEQARREERLSVESLLIGRGTDNEVSLPGLSISLHHATIRMQGEEPIAEGANGRGLQINGRRRLSQKLRPGDSLRIGRFDLAVLETQQNEDLVLEVSERIVQGDELHELIQRTQLGVEGGWFSRRGLSLAAMAAIFVLFLALPLLTPRLESFWSSGPISSNHGFIADDCASCHDAFQRVSDESCLQCHAQISRHTAAEVDVAELATSRCASCHIEHAGNTGLADLDQSFCAGCHADLGSTLSTTTLESASDFAENHPEFRLFVVDEPGQEARRKAVWTPGLQENSGLQFNHVRHVGRHVPHPDGSKRNLRCDACHTSDAAGKNMLPISFDRHCSGCHELGFDERLGDVRAPHIDPADMRVEIGRVYSDRVLRGAVRDPRAPRAVKLARPGVTLKKEEAEIVREWVDKQVKRAEKHLMEGKGECARCHEIRPGARDGGLDVAPVEVAEIWMPKSEFRHATHGPFPCRDCHGAAAVYDPEENLRGARPDWSLPSARPYALFTPEELRAEHGLAPSEQASDILLPGRKLCLSCHGGAEGGTSKIASRCVLCHPFHRSEHPPMREIEKVTHSSVGGEYNPARAARVVRRAAAHREGG